MKKIIFLFVILLITGSFIAQTSIPKFDDLIGVDEYKLENGLTVILSENHNTPTVIGGILVKAGGKNDPADATGIAHYLEHMLFKGTQDLGTTDFQAEKKYLDKIDSLYEVLGESENDAERKIIQKKINEVSISAGKYAIPNEMDGMLSEIGSTGVNAFTTWDMTAYHNEFPSTKMEEWLSIYAHRFQNPVFRLFQSELETVYEEKNRGEESLFGHPFEVFLKNFFKKHPYGQQSIIGETEHLKNPSLKNMYKFYNTYYVANNMALILVGDFDKEEVKPLIKRYFSNWKSGIVPDFPDYNEDDFKKGESITIRETPIKAFVRGYRSPKFGEYDAIALSMAMNILSNGQGSGLFDQLVNDGKLMTLEATYESMKDAGMTLFITIPKILGMSFDKANDVVDNAVKKIITGDFSDELFEGAKNEWIVDFEKEMEDSRSRAFALVQVYGYGKSWYEYINFIKAVKTINKEQLVEVAKKYFDTNYFTMYSKMGKYKPEKLDKPGFDPIIPENEGKHSDFYEEWSKVSSENSPKKLIQLGENIHFNKLSNGVELRVVKNEINEIFNLDIVWEVGYRQQPKLEILADLLQDATVENQSLTEFKNKLYSLGLTVSWEANEHQFIFSMEGLETNLIQGFELVNNLLKQPIIKDAQIKNRARRISTDRKVEVREPQLLSAVMKEYVTYGKHSYYLTRPSSKDYRKIKQKDFYDLYHLLGNYKVHIDFIGKMSSNDLQSNLNKLNIRHGSHTSDDYVDSYNKDAADVTFLNTGKSVQSHIVFQGIGNTYDKREDLSRIAFNYYFGLDMSSILFQEIREFRSLAYSTYGLMLNARNSKNSNLFTAYVGCQGDKTPESIALLHQLIKEMPTKESREKMVVNSLKNLLENSNPSFRNYIDLYDKSIQRGYTENYNIELNQQIPSLNFEEIVNYYNRSIQTLDLKLNIVGNKKKFNTSILKNYGEVKNVKLKDIYRK